MRDDIAEALRLVHEVEGAMVFDDIAKVLHPNPSITSLWEINSFHHLSLLALCFVTYSQDHPSESSDHLTPLLKTPLLVLHSG